ncbi:MAG: excinuclease ABC subunit UvrC [Thermodesulfobacteriota bacterium]
MEIEEKIEKLPAGPGVYLMKNSAGEVLYIGKAKNLRARVRSYFRATGDGRYAVRFLATRTDDVDVIVTANEKEALLLEDTLLKKYKPRYNIRLKDSKTYVSVKITVGEKFPRLVITRQIKKDGARYFGPYVSAKDVRKTVKFIRRIFPLCTCSPSVFKLMTRPCLDYQLGLCSAPAVGLISEEDYRELVDGAVMFLEGKNRALVRSLKAKMEEAAAGMDFERAARIRDRVSAIEGMLEAQRVVSRRSEDRDLVGVARSGGVISVRVLHIREGRLAGGDGFFFEDAGLPLGEVAGSFIAQFYRGGRFVPGEVIVPARPEDSAVVAEWLGEKRGRRVKLTAPTRGEKLKLLRMAESNAAEALSKKTSEKTAKAGVLEELARRLHLGRTPRVIEAFDISNISGTLTVGAMVNFTEGEPRKDGYRLYRVRTVEGPDDYAAMHEVLSRRFRGAGTPGKAAGDDGKEGGGMKRLPDLVLIDGGKGQLNIALAVMRDLGITGLELAAIAKDKPAAAKAPPGKRPAGRGERVFRPNVKDPVLLKEGTRADLLLRRIRDEVHRFAITYHRRLRSRAVGSVLEDIPGIGAGKSRALLKRFGSIDGVRGAAVEEVAEVRGITEKLALRIKEALDEEG